MPQTLVRQSEADARAQLLEVVERAGLELIRTSGIARTLILLHQHETVCGWVLDDLQVIGEHIQRAILHYRQQHEIDETRPLA